MAGRNWAGSRWGLPPSAPTDPDVLALEHPVPQPADSPPPKGPRGYPSESRGQADRTSMGSACCPRSSLPTDASLPSTGSSGASSPASAVLSRRYDSLPPIPPHFVAFVWRYLRVHSFSSLPGGRVRRRGPELLTRSPGRDLTEEATGSPRSLGTPECPFALFSRRRHDCGHQTIAVSQRGPRDHKSEGSHERSFDAQSPGFRTRCPRFAVRVTRAPRRTRFQPLVRLDWTGFPPAGFR